MGTVGELRALMRRIIETGKVDLAIAHDDPADLRIELSKQFILHLKRLKFSALFEMDQRFDELLLLPDEMPLGSLTQGYARELCAWAGDWIFLNIYQQHECAA